MLRMKAFMLQIRKREKEKLRTTSLLSFLLLIKEKTDALFFWHTYLSVAYLIKHCCKVSKSISVYYTRFWLPILEDDNIISQ